MTAPGDLYPYRTTSDKLAAAFGQIQETGDRIVLPLIYLGGRDFVIIARKAAADPERAVAVRQFGQAAMDRQTVPGDPR